MKAVRFCAVSPSKRFHVLLVCHWQCILKVKPWTTWGWKGLSYARKHIAFAFTRALRIWRDILCLSERLFRNYFNPFQYKWVKKAVWEWDLSLSCGIRGVWHWSYVIHKNVPLSYAYYLFESWQLPAIIIDEMENWTFLMNFDIMEIIS